jgi:lysophospholipase L1-like esterase
MRIKDGLFLMGLSLIAGWLVADSKATTQPVLTQDTIKQDTIKQDTVLSVKGKKALFIGDSHSAADYGWQHQVCKKTGMTYLNTAVGGKQTAWMLQEARAKVTPYFDYCFIYGGANDMASNRPPMNSVKNIQAIVNLCNKAHVTPIVITGFDPVTCINITGRDVYKGYPQRYAKFQQLLVDSIKRAIVIETHCISRTDCGDFLCHMTASGHRKMALCIIDKLNLKIYENLSPKKKHQEKELRVIENSKITIKQPLVEADK